MKSIKMFGTATIAALFAVALLGTGSATAEPTAFCAVDPGNGPEEVCPEGQLLTHLHGVTAAGLPMVILSTGGNIACESLLLLDTVEELSSPLVLEASFSYANCSGGCTVAEENGPAIIELLKAGHDKANAILEALLRVSCTGVNCRYVTEGMKGLFKGGLLPFNPEEDVFEEAVLFKESGVLCPAVAELDYLVGSLSAFYITR